MTSKMIDMDRICEMGWGILEIESNILRESGQCMMKFIIMYEGGYDVAFIPQAEVANSAELKDTVMAHVRELVKLRRAHALCTFSDMYLGEMSEEKLTSDLRQKINEIGMARASALGLVKKREALVLVINTRLETVLLCQYYRREIGKKDNKEHIVIEEKERKNAGEREGRFTKIFDDLPEAHA